MLEALQDSDQRSNRSVRILIHKLTLDNLAGRDGGELIKLVDRLLAPNDAVPPNYTILRHAELERLYGFPQHSDGVSLPLSKAVRALQSEMLLIRHSHLLVIIDTIFELLVSCPVSSIYTTPTNKPHLLLRNCISFSRTVILSTSGLVSGILATSLSSNRPLASRLASSRGRRSRLLLPLPRSLAARRCSASERVGFALPRFKRRVYEG